MRTLILFSILLLPLLGFSQADGPKDKKAKHVNRLGKETSPYLLMHAHNPTDWFPWGAEAFAKAKKEGKVVFLSVGYSSCYWCHVMERESFNHPAVAKVLNDSFVCIKVDREERPDIDNIYMTALQTMRGNTGWPMSMFLLPDGRPIVGGTYWPREDREVEGQKSPGFLTILKIVRDAYKEDPKQFEKQAEAAAKATLGILDQGMFGRLIGGLKRDILDGINEELSETFDPEFGGFGSPIRQFKGAKFPTPCKLDYLLAQSKRPGNEKLLKLVTLTLDRMAGGGIYDHLAGGFHRYSTERTWTVPHFEKMLYDNAQLVETYSKAFAHTKNPLYRRIVEETIEYVRRDMMSPEGAIYSSQDAETHHEEGRSYVWTAQELADALPAKEDLAFVRDVLTENGKLNFEEKYVILKPRKPRPELAAELKMSEDEFATRFAQVQGKLLAKRNQRDQPLLNKIALTAWSGQMIAGFAQAGIDLKEPKHVELAKKAAEFVLRQQKTKEGRLLRTFGAAPGQPAKAAVPGYLEDYAFLVHGLITLHEASKEQRWLDEAKSLTDTMIRFHGDDKAGGFYFTANDHEKLFARAKDQYDGAQPSGNSVAALNLVRLAKLTGDEKYRREAERTLQAFGTSLKTQGSGMTTMALALDRFLEK